MTDQTIAEMESEFKRRRLGESFRLKLQDNGTCAVSRVCSGELIETYDDLWAALHACLYDLLE